VDISKAKITVLVDESDCYMGHDSLLTSEEIEARQAAGDVWFWACIKVTASLLVDGQHLLGESEFADGFSYADEAAFRASERFESMKQEALLALSEDYVSGVRWEQITPDLFRFDLRYCDKLVLRAHAKQESLTIETADGSVVLRTYAASLGEARHDALRHMREIAARLVGRLEGQG